MKSSYNCFRLNAYVSFKLIHIAAIVVWSAGMLYLPGLFARHPATDKGTDHFERLRHQTRLVYVGLMSPAAVIAVASGTVLVFLAASLGSWMILKLVAVAALALLHSYLGRLMGLLYKAPDFRPAWAHHLLLFPITLVIIATITLVSWKPI
ncbi:MAG: CopD family protein [Wenzhouxiangella sp.]